MEAFAYYNGTFGLRKDARLPLTDRSVFFGDGVYDAAIGKCGRIFLEDEHIQRFLDNAEKLYIKHSYSHKNLSEIFNEIIKKFGRDSFFLYFQMSRKSDNRVHSAKKCSDANLLITIEPFKLCDVYTPLSLITAEDLRYKYCHIKTLNLLPSVIAASKADLLGCDEAVFHRDGIVTECSRSNVSIIKNGVLLTHPSNEFILPGITRKHLISACNELDIPYREIGFTLKELFDADEILITSTTKLCRCANLLDGREVGGKSSEISTALCRFMKEEFDDFEKNTKNYGMFDKIFTKK